jgi:hypothetical protein
MSIIQALKMQQADERSIDQLAMLPQSEIMRMAQLGEIPPSVLPVIISEKARMTQEQANRQAMMQGPQPTVLDKNLAINAQAAQPQMAPPQQAPQQAPQAGISGLPTGQMFSPQAMRGGGIVAFTAGGDAQAPATKQTQADPSTQYAPGPGGLMTLKSELPAQAPQTMQDYAQQWADIMAKTRTPTPEQTAYQESLKTSIPTDADAARQRAYMLTALGLSIAGGSSPFANVNFKEAAPAIMEMMNQEEKNKQQHLAIMKARSDAAAAKQQQQAEDLKFGAELHGKELELAQRKDIAEIGQEGSRYVENYFKAAREKGDTRPENIIKREGWLDLNAQKMALEDKRLAGSIARANVSAGPAYAGVEARTAGQEQELAQQAVTNVEKVLSSIINPQAREYSKLLKDDPAAAAKYKQNLVAQEKKLLRQQDANAPKAPPALQAKPETPQTPLAMPSDLKSLKDGALYKTSKGNARWDAKTQKFYLVE